MGNQTVVTSRKPNAVAIALKMATLANRLPDKGFRPNQGDFRNVVTAKPYAIPALCLQVIMGTPFIVAYFSGKSINANQVMVMRSKRFSGSCKGL
jgi:hypothetical protein